MIQSINGKILYTLAWTPERHLVRMNLEANCTGCSGFLMAWDRHMGDYAPYCDVFGVWNDFEDYGISLVPVCNRLCELYFRGPIGGLA